MATLEALLDTREIRCSVCLRVVAEDQLCVMPVGEPRVCGICLAISQVQSAVATSALTEHQEDDVRAALWRVFEMLRGR